MRKLRAALVAGLSTLSVASAAGASTQAAWLPPVTLSTGAVFAPDVAVNDRGDAVVAWQAPDRRIVARFRAAEAGEWGAPAVLGLGSEGGTRPGLAIDDDGDAVVAWRSSGPAVQSTVLAALRSATSGDWGAGVRLSNEGVTHEPVVRADEDGNTIAMWVRPDAERRNHLETAYRRAGSFWQPPIEVASGRWLFGLDLEVGPGGRALLSWVDEDAGNVVRAAFGRAGRWETPVELARDVAYLDTAAAIGGGGRAAVAWTRVEHGNSLVQVAVLLASESSWRVANLSFEDGQAGSPELAIDGSDNITAAWATNVDFEASFLAAGAETWRRPVAISPPKNAAAELTLAVNRGGDAVALWNSFVHGGEIVATRRPAGSLAWQAPATIGAGTRRLRNGLGLDGAGNAVVVWTHLRDDGFADAARAAAFDAAPPVLEIERAWGGHVGEPLLFRARAFDVWAGLAGLPRWSFGDGGSATGTSVRHLYRMPGEYTVTVEAADALGHVARMQAGVRIQPAQAVRNRQRPQVAGRRQVGRTLVCRGGRWTGSPPIGLAYRWLRNGRTVPGSTKRTYALGRRDAGTLVACRVRATNPAGTSVATSRAVRIAA
jgi:PKD domain